jgi:hypothetical protein
MDTQRVNTYTARTLKHFTLVIRTIFNFIFSSDSFGFIVRVRDTNQVAESNIFERVTRSTDFLVDLETTTYTAGNMRELYKKYKSAIRKERKDKRGSYKNREKEENHIRTG